MHPRKGEHPHRLARRMMPNASLPSWSNPTGWACRSPSPTRWLPGPKTPPRPSSLRCCLSSRARSPSARTTARGSPAGRRRPRGDRKIRKKKLGTATRLMALWLYRRLTTAVVHGCGRHLPRRNIDVDENERQQAATTPASGTNGTASNTKPVSAGRSTLAATVRGILREPARANVLGAGQHERLSQPVIYARDWACLPRRRGGTGVRSHVGSARGQAGTCA